MTAALLIEILDMALVASRIPSLMMEMRTARAQIQKMVDEGRNPNPEEIEVLMKRLRTARNRLQKR